MLNVLIDWILHLDTYLKILADNHGFLVYAVLFAVIFIETGVVVAPFLPGDSLLFIAGTLAAQQVMHLPILLPVLAVAAIAGDALNYALGTAIRKRTIDTHRLRLLKPEHIARTNAFFERHGPKAVVLARFVPIVRTLAPFCAALGRMQYSIFLQYNIIGGLLWVVGLVGAGYLLGNIPFVGDNLNAVVLGIIFLSVLPTVAGKIRKPAGTARQKN
ncbi:VTT domain-containing protein [Pusillimonas noertemannii]|uniref:VTT domain-containing protein n=1 Tax=Pusillimonas noertemannii TaxID=305977 RepID=UPI00030E093D|nr:VTT domain-containing protein [Pusillimonas noertemannii]